MRPDDELDSALRGGDDPVGRRVALTLRALRRPTSAVPRASEDLARFLAEAEVSSARARLADKGDSPVAAGGDVLGPFVIQVAGPPKRRRTMKTNLLVPVARLARLGLVAKLMLGATVALGGAGAVAATGALPDNDADVVVVTPATDEGAEEVTDDGPSPADDHEGQGLAGLDDDDDGDPTPEPDDVDEPDEEEPDEEEPDDSSSAGGSADQGQQGDDDNQGDDNDQGDDGDRDDEADDDGDDGDRDDEADKPDDDGDDGDDGDEEPDEESEDDESDD